MDKISPGHQIIGEGLLFEFPVVVCNSTEAHAVWAGGKSLLDNSSRVDQYLARVAVDAHCVTEVGLQ